MVELVCLSLPYAQYPLERAIVGIARAGYRYIGVGWPHQGEDVLGHDPEGELVRHCLARCREAGLTPLVVGRGPVATTERARQLKQRIDVARALGAKLIQMAGAGSFRRFPDEPLAPEVFQEAHQAFVADLQEAGAHALEVGLTIALKPHTGNTATAAHLAQTLAEIDSPAVQACYDPGNVHFYEGLSPEADFPLIAAQTREIVAKDHQGPRAENDFPVPGEGDIDFEGIFTTARQAGFSGPVIVERLNGTGFSLSPEALDGRILQARFNLEQVLASAGLPVE